MTARAATSILLAAVTAAALAGCGFVTPIATQFHYDPSDGVSAEVGEVTLRNALVLTEDGEDGNLLLTAVNDADETVRLGLQYVAGGGRVDLAIDLAPRSVTDLGFGEDGQLLLEGLDAPAGSLLPLYAQYGREEGVELEVPVLDGTLPQYAPYLPTPVPTPVETEAAGPEEEG